MHRAHVREQTGLMIPRIQQRLTRSKARLLRINAGAALIGVPDSFKQVPQATRFGLRNCYFRIVAQNVLSAPNGPPHSGVCENWSACPKSFIVSGKSTP